MALPVSSCCYAGFMSSADQIWLVAGGEPGAERFGQLVQRLRKEQHLSVERLAAQADLSVGTIRAIEQGRRAPSEESGVRLLRVLLPEGGVSKEKARDHETGALPSYSLTDPQSGSRVQLVFRARTAGDNRRWSSDGPRAGESKAEAFVRELMNDPTRLTEWESKMVPAFATFVSAIADVKVRAVRPASDAEFGRIARRLATVRASRIWLLEALLELWERVDGGTADEYERALETQIDELLLQYTPITEGEAPPPTE